MTICAGFEARFSRVLRCGACAESDHEKSSDGNDKPHYDFRMIVIMTETEFEERATQLSERRRLWMSLLVNDLAAQQGKQRSLYTMPLSSCSHLDP